MVKKISLLVFVLALLCACSVVHQAEESIADVEQGVVKTTVYRMNQQQADTIIRAAFHEGWPDKEMLPLETGKIGYSIKLWFAIDREHIIAEAVKADSGYKFRVINRGTAPVVGVPARGKLLKLIEKHAGSSGA